MTDELVAELINSVLADPYVNEHFDIAVGELFSDLVQFAGIPAHVAFRRCSMAESWSAQLWERAVAAGYPADDIYRFILPHSYLYDLTSYHYVLFGDRGFQLLLDRLARQPQCKVVDFGCGIGTYGLLFALYGHEVVGVDVAEPLLRFLRYRERRHGIQAVTLSECYVKGAEIVICTDVLEHLSDAVDVLDNVIDEASETCKFLLSYHFSNHEGRHPMHVADGDLAREVDELVDRTLEPVNRHGFFTVFRRRPR